MACIDRGMLPANRDRSGVLVMDGDRSRRFLNLWSFISSRLQIDPNLSISASELESAYEEWSGRPADRSGDMHNLSEFIMMLPDVEECVQSNGLNRTLYGVGLWPSSEMPSWPRIGLD